MNIDELELDEKFKQVLFWFKEMSKIPRGSHNLHMISDFFVQFAKDRNLEYVQDKYLNVMIKKAGTSNHQNAETIIIQGHMDMVAVKEADCEKDLLTQGLDLEIKDGYLFAKGTSLGADDGIAVAYMLAILASDSIEHPPLEMVITADEEVGLEGAIHLDTSILKGKTLLNIDSEEEGIFLVGCAGGARYRWQQELKLVKKQGVIYKVELMGLKGGHSGVEIHQPRANAILLLAEILKDLEKRVPFAIVDFQGGVADNAIPTNAMAHLLISMEMQVILEEELARIEEDAKKKWSIEEKLSLQVILENQNSHETLVLDDHNQIITLLQSLPNGVQSMSKEIDTLVETSLNLGKIEWKEKELIGFISVRSSVNQEKEKLIDKLNQQFDLPHIKVQISGIYPGWQYEKESNIRNKMVLLYEKTYGQKPKIEAIHAGLECGLFVEKIPKLDCISFGPNILDIHTTKERLEIASAQRVWDFMIALLSN